MKLQNTTTTQDATLTECEAFGGKAAEAAEIAQDLDNKLNEANAKIESLRAEVDRLTNREAELELQIRDLS